MEAIQGVLNRIMETGGMTADMERDVRYLKDELDERQGMLAHYGEFRNGENDSLQFVEKTNSDRAGDYQALEARYNDLKKRYQDNFWNPHTAHETDTFLREGDDIVEDNNSIGITMKDIIKTNL